MNCKPGDLAYVTVGVNAGRVVLVESPAARGWLQDGPFRVPPDSLPRWNVSAPRADLLIIDLAGNIRGGLKNRVIRDVYLRPISGVPVEDKVIEQVPA